MDSALVQVFQAIAIAVEAKGNYGWGRLSSGLVTPTRSKFYNQENDDFQTDMLKTLWATVRNGKVELLETTELPEGTKVLVTVLPDDSDTEFWSQASQLSLDAVWDNSEDDIYAQLLDT